MRSLDIPNMPKLSDYDNLPADGKIIFTHVTLFTPDGYSIMSNNDSKEYEHLQRTTTRFNPEDEFIKLAVAEMGVMIYGDFGIEFDFE